MFSISVAGFGIFRAVGRSPARAARITCGAALFLAMVISTGIGHCASVSWWQHPQREQVEIVFSQEIPPPDVRRIDPMTVRIQTMANAWDHQRGLTLPAFTGANYLEAMIPEGPGMLVRLQSKAFGFVTQYDEDSRRLTIDFFPDPLGGRWFFDPPAPERPPGPPGSGLQQPPVNNEVAEEELVLPAQTPAVPDEPDVTENFEPETRLVDQTEDPGAEPKLMQVRDSLQSPPTQTVQTMSSTSEFRSRIQRVGPEDALPGESAPGPAVTVDEARAPGQSITDRIEGPDELKPEPMQVRGQIIRTEPRAMAVEPDHPELVEPDPDLEELPEPVPESDLSEPVAVPAAIQQKPEDPEERFQTRLGSARAAMMNGEFAEAERILSVLASQADLPESMREKVLYDLADARFSLHLDDLAANFATVAEAYEQAMNVNPKSPRAATALRNLGVLHLRVNNLPEATAFFNVLRTEHPHDPLTPTADYYLGEHHFQRGNYDQAADHFETVVEQHPEHSIAQDSSLGLARSLYALGYDQRAFQVMDFVERRWPRYYLDDPSLLELAGIISLRLNHLDSAKERLLTYYNLDPAGPDAHMALTRLGDAYLLSGKPEAARHIFNKTARKFPDEEGGLIAQMRLVEGGIHDDPTLADYFANMRAAQVYTRIIEQHPQSPLADVATVKLAIWQVWNKRLEDSLTTVRDFLARRMHHSLAPRTLEVGMEAFSQLVDRNLQDGRFGEIIEQWELNDFLHPLEPDLSVETQLGLAMAFWKTGDHERAVQIARPHLRDIVPQQAKGVALDLLLGIYLEQQHWEAIAELRPLREELDLSADRLRELNYALALALENLGRPEESKGLWLILAEDLRLEERQRGYALYFLARGAMQDEDLEKVYRFAQEALSLLLVERKDSAKIRDCVSWLTQVTERTGRLQEALAWALELDQLMDEDDPQWAMSRYRLAQLYQRAQDHQQWRRTLLDLQQKDPRGLYGRLAGSALQGREIEESFGRFGP